MAPSGPLGFQAKIMYAPRSLFGNEGRIVFVQHSISPEARSCRGQPARGSAGAARSAPPAPPIVASANGDPGFFMLDGSKSRLRQGFAHRAKRLSGAKAPPPRWGGNRLAGQLARRPGHITASQHVEVQVRHTLPSLLTPLSQAPMGTPDFLCSTGVNPASAKVLRIAQNACPAQKRRRPGGAGIGSQAN